MLTTEDEAKTKRCPQSFPACAATSSGGLMVSTASPFAHDYSNGAGTSYATPTAPSMCIGSACMAWRWETWAVYGPDGTFRNVIDCEPPPDGSLLGGPDQQPFTYKRLGYCGKAGHP